MRGDALENYKMLKAVGCSVWPKITEEMRIATLVIDAVLGTGRGRVRPRAKPAELIAAINDQFPMADVVAVDVPSGWLAIRAKSPGRRCAPNTPSRSPRRSLALVLSPACELAGEVHVAPIGTPPRDV